MAYSHTETYARAVAEVYGYRLEQVRGHWLFRIGKTWCNTPFSEYGIEVDVADEAFLGALPRPYRIKVEGPEGAEPVSPHGAHALGRLGRLALEPELDEDAYFGARDRQIRKAVRKAGRAGWIAEAGPFTAAHLDDFYGRYTRYVQQRHGSPPLGRKHFAAMQRAFGDDMVACRVVRGDDVGATLLGYVDRATSSCQITDIVTDPDHLSDRVADLAHWGLVARCRELGLQHFDFGITRYEGQEYYKRKWGCEFRGSWSVSSEPNDRPADPDSGIYPLVRKVWRKLPHSVHCAVGPALRRYLGA